MDPTAVCLPQTASIILEANALTNVVAGCTTFAKLTEPEFPEYACFEELTALVFLDDARYL